MQPLRPDDPRQVGPYRLEGRLGAGGMGEVFRGVSPSGRAVAVKIVRAEYAADPEFRRRFAREIEAARRVGGFHTAQVVDADPDAASPWLVTAYIPGPSLRQVVLRQGPLAPDAVRELGAGLAEGLAAIHACGLVHRDLKPGNVIMGPDGPRIIDFGIARAADATALTSTGAVVGTFSFMSPEQVRADATGPASDVFSLGCVLAYAALGRGPFDAPTIPAIVRRIVATPPDLAGLADPGLRDVVGRCLEKDPRRRPSVPDVLTGLTTGVPRRVPRRAVLFGGAGAAAAAAVAVPAALLWPGGRRNNAPKTPLTVPTVVTLPSTETTMYALAYAPDGRTLVGAGYGSLLRWDLATARVSTREVDDDATYKAPMALSPDGRVLATGGEDGNLHLRDTGTGQITRKVPARGVTVLAFAPDGRSLAVGPGDARHELWVWNTVTGRQKVMTSGGNAVAVAFSPDGKRLGGRLTYGELRVWDAADGSRTADASSRGDFQDCLAFSRDGETVAISNGYEGSVEVRSASDGRLRATFRGVRARALAFSPDGDTLVGVDEEKVRVLHVPTRRVTATFPGDGDDYHQAVVFAPDGQSFATAGGSGTTRFYRF